jgi:hypothetical protein
MLQQSLKILKQLVIKSGEVSDEIAFETVRAYIKEARPTVRKAVQQRKGESDNRQCLNMVTCSHANFGCANGCKGYSPSPVA